MFYAVINARYVRDFIVWVKFEDGSEGEVDLSSELLGGVFEPLKDVNYFRLVTFNPDIGTITWPNAADFAPEFLYESARALR